jgi:hypothetical protein
MVQSVDCLPSKHETLSSEPKKKKCGHQHKHTHIHTHTHMHTQVGRKNKKQEYVHHATSSIDCWEECVLCCCWKKYSAVCFLSGSI